MAQKFPGNVVQLTPAQIQRIQNTGIPLYIDGSKGGHTFVPSDNGRTIICTNTPALTFPLGLGDGFQVPIMGAFTVSGSGQPGMAIVNGTPSTDASATVTLRQTATGVYGIAGGGSSGPASVLTVTGALAQGSVLTATPSAGWSFPTTPPGQWYRNGAAISGETAITHTIVSADLGATITFTPTTLVYSGAVSVPPPAAGTVYDIILSIGQSNQRGNAEKDPAIDTTAAYLLQFGSAPTITADYRSIVPAIDRLEGPDYATMGTTTLMGPAMNAAKARYAVTGNPQLIVPLAYGGTGLVEAGWNPFGSSVTVDATVGGINGSMANNAIAQAKLAVAAAQAAKPGSKVTMMNWLQGEYDGASTVNVTGADYMRYLFDLIAAFRTQVPTAADAPFIIGSVLPELLALNAGTIAQINQAHSDVAAAAYKVSKVSIASGYAQPDKLHYTSPGLRLMGTAQGTTGFDNATGSGDAVPGVIANLVAGTPTSVSIPLTITPPSSGGTPRFYEIQYALAGSGTWVSATKGFSTLVSAGVLQPSTAYDVRVRAGNYGGINTYQVSAWVTLTNISTPALPAGTVIQLPNVVGTAITESAGPNYTYTAATGSSAAADRRWGPTQKMPLNVDCEIRVPVGTGTPVGGCLTGFQTSPSSALWNTGLTGFRWGINGSGTSYLAMLGANNAVPLNGVSGTVAQAGDILRFVKVSNYIYAYVARSATPTTWIFLHWFSLVAVTDLYLGIAVSNSNATARTIGPIMGYGTVAA